MVFTNVCCCRVSPGLCCLSCSRQTLLKMLGKHQVQCVRVQCSLYQQWAIWKIIHLESWAERQLRKVVHRNSLVYNPPFINPLPSLHFILVFVEILGGDLGLSIHGLYSSCLCCDFNCTQASVCVCLLTGCWGSQLFGVWVTWWEVCDVCLRGKKADCPTFWC